MVEKVDIMNNTIRLLKGEAELTKREFETFTKGDTIWGADREPEELKRWSIEQAEEARAELAKYKSIYQKNTEDYSIKEYALEYFETDEQGEFVNGSEYDLAEEE